jgi:hypothetical protein
MNDTEWESTKKMRGAAVVDKAEQIKWADALDELIGPIFLAPNIEAGLRMARECCHPDARWLAALFPPGVVVTKKESMREVMLQQGEDPQALFIGWHMLEFSVRDVDASPLLRSAELGYAPAQAALSVRGQVGVEGNVKWAELAAVQGERLGMCSLGLSRYLALGCAENREEGIGLLKRAADLESPQALSAYGQLSFDRQDWEWYEWCGRAALRGHQAPLFAGRVARQLPMFQSRKLIRVLHTAAPVVRVLLDPAYERLLRGCTLTEDAEALGKIVRLDARLVCARLAIACWGIVACRLGVAKDMRIMIAKIVWEQAWELEDTVTSVMD